MILLAVIVCGYVLSGVLIEFLLLRSSHVPQGIWKRVGRTLAWPFAVPVLPELGAVGARNHKDADAGFVLTIPSTWHATLPQREFAASEGHLSIAHNSNPATLNVRVGALEKPEHESQTVRLDLLHHWTQKAGFTRLQLDMNPFAGEVNAIKGRWLEGNQVAGLISAVHEGREYVIQWRTGMHYSDLPEIIIASFRFG